MPFCLFLGIYSFRRYLKAVNIISVPITLFFPQASQADARSSSAAPLNMNHYANKKSAAESMLDVALLMANASQLKAVLEQGPNLSLYAPIITLISISLCLQVTVGILLIFIGEKVNRVLGLLLYPRCLCPSRFTSFTITAMLLGKTETQSTCGSKPYSTFCPTMHPPPPSHQCQVHSLSKQLITR